ncbi:protein of unknown function [Beijerinckiaceae bacterium RH AL1]|nr:protein of unknown function [Beijerinckiaceae bacterium RH CH11]VVB46546.1 protein of unknown function [Beijerinckiaceae bacterium RH AL8]VVC55386.1 protein of unknown function [Beijerinckiaceae bacterium RH AL1]
MPILVEALRRTASLAFLHNSPVGAWLYARAAETAQAQGMHREAADLWRQARARRADNAMATARLAACLRRLGEPAEARAILEEALARSPDDVRLLSEAARLAQERADPQAAVDLWRRAMARAKPHADWLQSYTLSLLALGDLDAAAREVAAARRKFPDFVDLIATEGWVANARQDWPLALACWTEHRRRAPDDTTTWEAYGTALHGAQMSGAVPELAPVRADIVALDDAPMRRLMLGFESLGDSCEMGLVQRRFGAEPLSLLRWNDVALENLIAALGQRFEGMGEPENTVMVTASNGELYLRDRRWDLAMHTFRIADRVDADDIFQKMCRRIAYLRDKLLDDLASAEKVFVYRSDMVDAGGLRRLHEALRAHGPVTLLGVQPVLTDVTAFPGRPVGGIERLEEGLYLGFLAQPANPTRADYNIDFEAWTKVFTQVAEATRRTAAGRRAEPHGAPKVA